MYKNIAKYVYLLFTCTNIICTYICYLHPRPDSNKPSDEPTYTTEIITHPRLSMPMNPMPSRAVQTKVKQVGGQREEGGGQRPLSVRIPHKEYAAPSDLSIPGKTDTHQYWLCSAFSGWRRRNRLEPVAIWGYLAKRLKYGHRMRIC